MKIKTTKALTLRDSDTGALFSPRKGAILDVTDEEGEGLIDLGYAEEYTLITPKGTLLITENGANDVTEYAKATVNVPNPSSGTLNVTENGTYDCTNYASVTVAVPAPASNEPAE